MIPRSMGLNGDGGHSEGVGVVGIGGMVLFRSGLGICGWLDSRSRACRPGSYINTSLNGAV